jgi:ribosomal protein S6--L-glutamate ligase
LNASSPRHHRNQPLRLLLVARFVPERGVLDTIGIPGAAIRRGHLVDVVPSSSFDGGAVQEAALTHDVVICRFSGEPRGAAALDAVAALGVPVIGGGGRAAIGDDQVFSLEALERAGVATPEYFVINSPSAVDLIGSRFGYPVVTKDPRTMGGGGVRLAYDPAAVLLHLEELDTARGLVVQRFYSEAAGQDRRLFVVDSEVVGAVRRVAPPGEFRANLYLGGTAYPHRPSTREAALAVAAAGAVGLDVAGVDVLPTLRGPLVVEVNHNPGATGIARAAEAIVMLAERCTASIERGD